MVLFTLEFMNLINQVFHTYTLCYFYLKITFFQLRTDTFLILQIKRNLAATKKLLILNILGITQLVEQLPTDGDAKDLLAEIAQLKAESVKKPKVKGKRKM